MAEDLIDPITLMKAGWRYHDLPKMSAAAWEFILEGLGADGVDYHILAWSEYRSTDGFVLKRGQLLISPAGAERLGMFKQVNAERFAALFPR